MGMFDFDGNGHTSSGEHFIGYQILRDVTGSGSSGSSGGTGLSVAIVRKH